MTRRTQLPDKLFFKIGEVADIVGVKPHALRYWETEFPSLRPKKNRAGNRNYRPKDIKAILVIRDLLYREKFTISGARKKLQEHYGNPDPLINQLQIPFADPEARQILMEEFAEDAELVDGRRIAQQLCSLCLPDIGRNGVGRYGPRRCCL